MAGLLTAHMRYRRGKAWISLTAAVQLFLCCFCVIWVRGGAVGERREWYGRLFGM